MFYVETMLSNLTAKLVHIKNGIYLYKGKDGREYANVEVNAQDVYEIERCYRWNTSIPNLKRAIYRIKNMSTLLCKPFLCIVYTLHSDAERADDIEILPHENFKESNLISHRPYIRTDATVLKHQEDLLSNNKSPQEVYEIVLEESGGALHASSMSKEPRNLKQVQNLQAKINKSNRRQPESSNNDLDVLLHLQKDQSSFVQTVTVTREKYLAFAFTEKQTMDIDDFCCQAVEPVVIAVDTTSNLCSLWITDTTYQNKRILNASNGNHPIHLAPVMLHFTKDDATFSRLASELLSSNPNSRTLKGISVDLESAIFNGFKKMIPNLNGLICVQHLMKPGEKKLNKLLPKTGRNIADCTRLSREIIKDIYGVKDGNAYEYGLAEALDGDDFTIKLQSLKDRWESLCPGFFDWLKKTRVSQFLESVTQTARIGYDSEVLY